MKHGNLTLWTFCCGFWVCRLCKTQMETQWFVAPLSDLSPALHHSLSPLDLHHLKLRGHLILVQLRLRVQKYSYNCDQHSADASRSSCSPAVFCCSSSAASPSGWHSCSGSSPRSSSKRLCFLSSLSFNMTWGSDTFIFNEDSDTCQCKGIRP